MSAFNKVAKFHQKEHRERGQLQSRSHLGLLGKRKDYQIRAKDFNRKQETLKKLKRKARDHNPDEFCFKMVRTALKDGEHQCEDNATPEYSDEQLKKLTSQDISYLKYRQSIERNKIAKLQAELHLISVEDKPKNSHIVFLDDEEQVKNFDAAKHFKTDKRLLSRRENRSKMDEVSEFNLPDPDTVSSDQQRAYKELTRRIARERDINLAIQKFELKNQLLDKMAQKKLVKEETSSSAAQYRWLPVRKK